MRHGLFPKDDISEKDTTEFRRDLNFEGLRPKTDGRMHSLPEKRFLLNPQSKITDTGPYRYRLEGIGLAS